jgi:nucleotide-binding universal stress UspA family protein
MIHDILVHIPTERSARPVIDAAISLAMDRGAHLDALAVGYVSASTAFAVDGAAAIAAEAIEQEQGQAQLRAEPALRAFESEARNAGISYSCHSCATFPAEAAASIGAAARLYDLVVVLQPDAEHASFDNTVSQEVLFRSGRPVLFIPYIFRGTFQAKRIGVCWDGSRAAARAVKDAMPFLRNAEALITIAVNEPENDNAELAADKLGQHLRRANLSTTVISLEAKHREIQPMIASLSADSNLDLLVMGGYGHSRLQEAVLGGVSRAMLASMTVPTLMSH